MYIGTVGTFILQQQEAACKLDLSTVNVACISIIYSRCYVLHVLPSIRPTHLVTGHIRKCVISLCSLLTNYLVAYINGHKIAVNNKLNGVWQQAASAQSGTCPMCPEGIKKIKKNSHNRTSVSAEFVPGTFLFFYFLH